jgi:hypothetical protein
MDMVPDQVKPVQAASLILNDDMQDKEISDQFVAFRFGLGVGIENLPAISNHYSATGSTPNFSVQTGAFPITANGLIHSSFINSKWFRIFAQPEGQFGVTIRAGSLGYYAAYGGKAGFSIGNMVRLLGEYGYYNKMFSE